MWNRFAPYPVLSDPVLVALEGYLARPEVQAELEADDEAERYPAGVLDALRARGLSSLLSDVDGEDPKTTAYHLCALNVLAASCTGSLGITLGVNSLALISAYIAATPEQLERILGRVRAGAFSSMALTELAHGSNLLRTQARAEAGTLGAGGEFIERNGGGEEATHYRLRGTKDLINGGQEHELLFLLLRTRTTTKSEASDPSPLSGRGAHSFFCIPRQEGISGLSAWATLPGRAADISGLEFDLVVESGTRLGPEGEGFSLTRKTLSMSRGGVASLAAGTVARARAHAWDYAQRREISGEPIAGLGAIADHLMRLDALDRAAAAISLRSAAWMNATGLKGALYSGIAKLMACRLAEEGVDEGRRLLGGRALLRGLPYERLVRDVLLFGVFDGTSHVMLTELQARVTSGVRQWRSGKGADRDTIAETRAVYDASPRSLVQSLRERSKQNPLPLILHLRSLAALPGEVSLEPLAELGECTYALVEAFAADGAWGTDQGLRFELTEAVALLEVLVALVEVCDLDRREHFIARKPEVLPFDRPGYRFALQWFSGRVWETLAARQAKAGLEDGWLPAGVLAQGGLCALLGRLQLGHDAARRELAASLKG